MILLSDDMDGFLRLKRHLPLTDKLTTRVEHSIARSPGSYRTTDNYLSWNGHPGEARPGTEPTGISKRLGLIHGISRA